VEGSTRTRISVSRANHMIPVTEQDLIDEHEIAEIFLQANGHRRSGRQ
jgi:hypothetical protein